MHLLAATPGAADEGAAVDPGQTPADLVLISAADTELALLAEARAAMADPPVAAADQPWPSAPPDVGRPASRRLRQPLAPRRRPAAGRGRLLALWLHPICRPAGRGRGAGGVPARRRQAGRGAAPVLDRRRRRLRCACGRSWSKAARTMPPASSPMRGRCWTVPSAPPRPRRCCAPGSTGRARARAISTACAGTGPRARRWCRWSSTARWCRAAGWTRSTSSPRRCSAPG